VKDSREEWQICSANTVGSNLLYYLNK